MDIASLDDIDLLAVHFSKETADSAAHKAATFDAHIAGVPVGGRRIARMTILPSSMEACESRWRRSQEVKLPLH